MGPDAIMPILGLAFVAMIIGLVIGGIAGFLLGLGVSLI